MRWPAWPMRSKRPPPGPKRPPLTIAILSFNRPHYLREVLHSLRGQLSENDQVILVQDGAVNALSGHVKASDDSIRQCIDLFRFLIPGGTVLAPKGNLGIALNYERAETYVFETLGRPHGLFLEDDLVLSPHYLDAIASLLAIAQADRRIAYVSAYGNMWATLDEQRIHRSDVQHMHENWGFAMTRQAWLDERPFRALYLALLDGRDYSARDQSAILAFYRARGWETRVSSQDCARWIASLELGKVRLTTFACYARYIGEAGEHFSPQHFYQCGFDKTLMLDGCFTPPLPPTTQQIDDWLMAERKRFRGEPSAFYAGHAT